MNVPEKIIHEQVFTEGINTVVTPRLMKNTQARDILNCNSLSTAAGLIGSLTNVKGNVLIFGSLPAGVNTTIGYAQDKEKNNLYYFNHNSNGYHGIYRFNSLERTIIPVIRNLTDTNNIDILRFDVNFPIYHAIVINNNLLYWVDGLNNARKTNIERCLDKSLSGYGATIREEYINAYKPAPVFPAQAKYISDLTKPFNTLYGQLYKFIYRFIYVDGERSNWSDFSNVPLPENEPVTGITAIPTNNNGIEARIETGSPDVKHIEIAMQSTNADIGEDAILKFVTIAFLDKKVLNIPSDSIYTYTFYNDNSYTATDMKKVVRPHSFLPKKPRCQAVVENAITYFNFEEGEQAVEVDVEWETEYTDLFIEPGIENEFNKPKFILASHDSAYVRGSNGNREVYDKVLVGPDVKKGNVFSLRIFAQDGKFSIELNEKYTANSFDTAETVANYFRAKVDAWDPTKNGTTTGVTVDTEGNAFFNYTIRWYNYAVTTTSVTAVQFNTLKDTGESVNVIKHGSSKKIGIQYEDGDGRKSPVYTNDGLIIGIKTINELGGFKRTVLTLRIKHRPPVWAKHYQIMRSKDLTYGDYIQMLVQDVSVVEATNNTEGEYLDLAVGSLFTYQRLHENTVLNYEFKKGDRIRLISNFDAITSLQTYYSFYESEVLSYRDSVETLKNDVISTTEGSNILTITGGAALADNIDKVIIIDGVERTITGVPEGNKYSVNNSMTETKTFPSYKIVDRRGTIRVRKPPVSIIPELMDLSLIEVYTPALNSVTPDTKPFFEFTKKFPIINWGTEQRAHGGMVQDQNAAGTIPAIIKIENGTAYVRNRELPITNVIPNAQVLIGAIEDAGYSDFYNSKMNDNGRVNVEDTGQGKVHFGSRARHSNSYIEGTRINGLNDFDYEHRKDYNDQYGDFILTVVGENRIYGFKELKDTWIPVRARVITQSGGSEMLQASSDLLNDIQYFAHDGGIGHNPESFAEMGTMKYHVSANAGIVVRLGGNGVFPISEHYFVDNDVRERLKLAEKNKARIPGGCDPDHGLYIFSVNDYENKIFDDVFNESTFEVTRPEVGPGVLFEIVLQPSNGTLVYNSATRQVVYTPAFNYVGSDSFTYRVYENGAWTQPHNVCVDVTGVPEEYAWRPKEGTEFCVTSNGYRTGYRGWNTLEQYGLVSENPNGTTKPNDPADADYVAPVYNILLCTIEEPDTTPNPLIFTPITGAEISTEYTSNAVTILGVSEPVPVTVSGVGVTYSKNGGAFTNEATTGTNGDTFVLKHPSSAEYSTPKDASLQAGTGSGTFTITTKAFVPPPPECPDRRVVIQICNENAAKDDNFDVYLNDTYIGYLDLSLNQQIGSLFVASDGDAIEITDPDFPCPLTDMVYYFFSPALLRGGTNKINMVNTAQAYNGNYGTIQIRNYKISPTNTLIEPCVIGDATYSGSNGQSFELFFEYDACCPGDI